MNWDTGAVWQSAVILAGGTLALALLVTTINRFVQRPIWQRTVVQACILTIFTCATIELVGLRPRVVELWSKAPSRTPARETPPAPAPAQTSSSMPMETNLVSDLSVQIFAPTPAKVVRDDTKVPSGETIWFWLACVWLIGAAILVIRLCLSRLIFFFYARGKSISDDETVAHIHDLADRVGIHRSIRVIELSKLRAPIAFGLFRPGIGLPPGFADRLSSDQRAVMLVHELSHLAACDGAWYLLADLTAALLWWHPAVWWLRRKLHQASEAAADEASLLVPNGPHLLAECLVRLGRQLDRKPSLAWMSMAGFRSGLGRRVEALFRLRSTEKPSRGTIFTILTKALTPPALLLTILLCAGWIFPRPQTTGAIMKNQVWKQSLPALALAGLLHSSAQAEKPAAPAEKKPAPARETAKKSPPPPSQPKWRGADDVRYKLSQVILEQVSYDGLPLGEIVRQWVDETARQDRTGVGINFLLVNPTTTVPVIDPATGLPQAGTAEPVNLAETIIRIVPPLKQVRLIDLLDAITKVADRPLRYSIGDYGVILTMAADPASLGGLETQTFQVQPDIFFKGIESTFGIKMPGGTAQAENVSPSLAADLARLKVRQAEDEFKEMKSRFEQGLVPSLDLKRSEYALEAAKLELQAAEAGRSTPPGSAALNHLAVRVKDARINLTTLRSKYGDEHPTVKEAAVALEAAEHELSAEEQDVKTARRIGVPPREVQQEMFRELFEQLGLRLEPPRSIFFNELTGIVMVRVMTGEMDAVRAAIETLGGKDPSKLAVASP